MPKLLIGPACLFLMTFNAGCATSTPVPQMPVEQAAEMCRVPPHLVTPLPAPQRMATHNRDLLQLLADYESLRRRANADRAAVDQQQRPVTSPEAE